MVNKGGMQMLQPILKHMKLQREPIQLRSFYGNMQHIEGDEIKDVKIHDKNHFEYQEYFPFISTTAESFDHGLAGEEIRARFSKKCRFEV